MAKSEEDKIKPLETINKIYKQLENLEDKDKLIRAMKSTIILIINIEE